MVAASSGSDPIPVALARIDHAHRLLAEARTLSDIKDVRDKAEAVRQYSRTSGLTVEIQNLAAEIKIRAERKAGELLTEMPKNRGDAEVPRDIVSRGTSPPTLEEIGITRKQSSRWQAVAAIPEPVFEQVISETKTKARLDTGRNRKTDPATVLSTAGMVRAAAAAQKTDDLDRTEQIIAANDPATMERINRSKLQIAFHEAMKGALELFLRLDPEALAETNSPSDAKSLAILVQRIPAWHAKYVAARSKGLRVVPPLSRPGGQRQ